jgi:hypothetical protein
MNDYRTTRRCQDTSVLSLEFGHFERVTLGKFQTFSEHRRDPTSPRVSLGRPKVAQASLGKLPILNRNK